MMFMPKDPTNLKFTLIGMSIPLPTFQIIQCRNKTISSCDDIVNATPKFFCKINSSQNPAIHQK